MRLCLTSWDENRLLSVGRPLISALTGWSSLCLFVWLFSLDQSLNFSFDTWKKEISSPSPTFLLHPVPSLFFILFDGTSLCLSISCFHVSAPVHKASSFKKLSSQFGVEELEESWAQPRPTCLDELEHKARPDHREQCGTSVMLFGLDPFSSILLPYFPSLPLFFILFIFFCNKLNKQKRGKKTQSDLPLARCKFVISEKLLHGCCRLISHQDGSNVGERSVTDNHRASLRSLAPVRTSREDGWEAGGVFIPTVSTSPGDRSLRGIPELVLTAGLTRITGTAVRLHLTGTQRVWKCHILKLNVCFSSLNYFLN